MRNILVTFCIPTPWLQSHEKSQIALVRRGDWKQTGQNWNASSSY